MPGLKINFAASSQTTAINLMAMSDPLARRMGLMLTTNLLLAVDSQTNLIGVSNSELKAKVAALTNDPVPEVAAEARKILERTTP
jgi:hypothetical protein